MYESLLQPNATSLRVSHGFFEVRLSRVKHTSISAFLRARASANSPRHLH
jgi:hypothetical protein